MVAPKRIGIAVVKHEGRYLVGIRGPDIPLAGFAEFPGGKCLTDESPADCAVRECREETGLEIAVDRLLHRLEYECPHAHVDLHFLLCHPQRAADVQELHHGFGWFASDDLKLMTFPEANSEVLALLE